jgi:hypothetical protein
MSARLRRRFRGGVRRWALVPCARCGGLGPLFPWSPRAGELVCVECVEGLLGT